MNNLQEIYDALDSFSALGEDWDTYKGLPIRKEAVEEAKRLVRKMFLKSNKLYLPTAVVPNSRGAVALEWALKGGSLEVEIFGTYNFTVSFELICNPAADALSSLDDILREFIILIEDNENDNKDNSNTKTNS